MTLRTVGLDLGHTTVEEAEHWLHELHLAGPVIACTHLVHGDRPRVALSVSGAAVAAAPPIDASVAAAVAVEHAVRRSGRAVIYPGVGVLTGTLPVEELIARSAIERVVVIGGPPAGPDSLVETRDFVRPQWKDGLLTLVATPAPGGRIAPFEVGDPPTCC